MKRKAFRIGALMIAIVFTVAMFAACGSTATNDKSASTATAVASTATASTILEAPKPDPAELNFYFWGDEPNQLQSVLNEFHNRTKDTLNITLKFSYTPMGDYVNKVNVKLSAGEAVDSVFDAQWMQMPAMIGKGSYVNLDQYFLSDKYPGLKKAFDEPYVKNNLMTDSKNESHTYGIPFTRNYGAVGTIALRKDLRLKYGLPECKTLEDVEKFYDAVLQNEKGIIPFAPGGGFSWRFGESAFNKVMPWTGVSNNGLNPNVAIVDGKVLGVFSIVDDWTTAASPYNSNEVRDSSELIAQKWYEKGYVEKDLINEKDPVGMFKAGKAVSVATDTAGIYDIIKGVQSAVPGADVEMFILDPKIRNFEKGALSTQFKAWNFACIPSTSKNVDRTMMFFDWLFADQANHDLFEYGIEGTNWIADGTDKYKIPDGVDASKNYNLMGYELTWNPNYVRFPVDYPADALKIDQYQARTDSYFQDPLTGFSFNTEPVKSEITKVAQAYVDGTTPLMMGLQKDVPGAKAKILSKINNLGWQKIKDELAKQIQVFLDSKK